MRNLNNFTAPKVPRNGMIYKKTVRNGRICFFSGMNGCFSGKDSEYVQKMTETQTGDFPMGFQCFSGGETTLQRRVFAPLGYSMEQSPVNFIHTACLYGIYPRIFPILAF